MRRLKKFPSKLLSSRPEGLKWSSVALAIMPMLAVTVSLPAVAQQEQSALEEIVVTARYREENLQQSPLAISAISAKELSIRGFTSSADVALSVPNASFRPAQAAFGNTLTAFIRGIGQNDFNFAFEPGVGVYIDDVYHPTTMGSMMDLMDLERVEVLRGPQGTLFGRGSIGGAIRMVSKKPQGDNTGNIQVTTGEYNRIDVRASYDFAISDSVFARIAGVSKTREGYQDVIDFACAYPAQAGTLPARVLNRNSGCKLGTQGGEDVTGYRAALRWAISDSADLTLTYDRQDDDSEVRADTLLAVNVIPPYTGYNTFAMSTYGVAFDNRFIPNDVFTTYATFDDPLVGLAFDPVTSLESEGVSAKFEYSFADNHGMTLIVSRREFHSKFAVDNDNSPLNIQMTDGYQDFESDTAELRFNGRIMDKLDYTVGLFTYDGEVTDAQTVSFPGLLVGVGAPYPTLSNGVLVNALNTNKTEHDSAFGHVVYDISEHWSVSAGFRWSDDSKSSDFDNTIVQSTIDTSADRWDWKVGVDYRVNDDVMVYASAASGYRPEAYNPRPFQVTQFVAVDGEEAVSYDVGIKGDFLENSLRVNAAIFYVDYKQRITPQGGTECLLDMNGNYATVPAGTPGAVTDSLGNICLATTSRTFYINTPGKIKGFELESTWNPVGNLTLTAVYGYTDWDSPDINDDPTVITDTPPYVPKSNWSLAAAYDFELGGGGMLTPRVDVYGQDDICTGVTSTRSCSDGYQLVNARVQWASAGGDWTAALGVTNATDEEYFYNKFDLSAFGQPTTEGQPGRPQEWYLMLNRNF